MPGAGTGGPKRGRAITIAFPGRGDVILREQKTNRTEKKWTLHDVAEGEKGDFFWQEDCNRTIQRGDRRG